MYTQMFRFWPAFPAKLAVYVCSLHPIGFLVRRGVGVMPVSAIRSSLLHSVYPSFSRRQCFPHSPPQRLCNSVYRQNPPEHSRKMTHFIAIFADHFWPLPSTFALHYRSRHSSLCLSLCTLYFALLAAFAAAADRSPIPAAVPPTRWHWPNQPPRRLPQNSQVGGTPRASRRTNGHNAVAICEEWP